MVFLYLWIINLLTTQAATQFHTAFAHIQKYDL